MPMSGRTISSGEAIGGSETAALQAARELARLGHNVNLFCNTEAEHEVDDVVFKPMGWVPGPAGQQAQFPKGFFDYARATPCDVMLIQRQPMLFQFDYPSKCNILWQHDLATKTGPSQFGGVAWNIDRIFLLSQFMKRQYQQVHGGPDSLYHLTRNGIDLDLIDSVPEQPRDRFKLLYTARPERGLDILLTQVWPEILKREPRARLYVSRYSDPTTLPLYEELNAVAAQYGNTIVNLGNLGKKDLYRHYKQSRLFLYSSVFEEISHISSMELAGCGTVMIGPWKAACPETCAGAHVLIRDDGSLGAVGDPIDPGFKPVTPQFVKAFVDQTIDLMHNDQRWEALSKQARNRAEQWQWRPVAEEWTDLFHDIIGKKSSDTKRMMKHFIFNSDVVAAQKYAEKHNDPVLNKAVDKYCDRFMPFMRIKDADEQHQAIVRFYEERSGGEAADYRTAFWADTEPRLKAALEFIDQHPDIKSILDFGCAHGGYVRSLSNHLPAATVVGLDVSPSLIRCCNELKASHMPDGSPAFLHPENVEFVVGDEDAPIANYKGEVQQFDAVVCMELLEHLPNSEEVIAKLERHCKPGGWMILTVPVGHNERSEFVMKGIPPVHVRAFDMHDLRDILGHRKDFEITTISDCRELELDRTFYGWHMVMYRNDGQQVGQIDWERKFFLQAPRETLAVCYIANNVEDVLHRSMRSIHKIADQIVVLDNGPSTDRTVDVAAEYTEDVRAGTSPFFCYAHLGQHSPDQIIPGTCDMAGFETPRNESIENTWADWILWIDSDEQLLEWRNLWKYLRPNMMLGYAVRQHHIAVDPAGILKEDIPVRLFRNRAGISFYGKVHEHAELGINKGVGIGCMLIPDIHIHHDGYLTETIRRARFWRNFKLLECDRLAYPDRTLGIFLYEIRDNMHLAKYALEQNGQRVTPEVRKHLTIVVETFRKFFMSDDYPFLTQDALNYYSEALAFLGIGLEVCCSLDVRPQGAQLNGTQRFRATDEAEANRLISKLLKAKFQPFEGPYVA